MKTIIFLVLGFLVCACASTQDATPVHNKTADVATEDGKYIISAQIVSKNFVMKNGKVTEHSEYYVRRSIQDYFIKFCEGNVTTEELEKHLKKQKGELKSLTLEIEIKDGMWDSCDAENLVQSRTGPYIVIYRIVEE